MEQHGIQTLAVDLSDPDQLSRVPQTENVFFLAGVKFGTGNDSALLQRMNVEMPELVAQHFARSRIVALSTGCVYSFARPESGGSMEEDPLDPPGPYAQSCIGREQAFVQGSRQHGTPVTLVRLNYAIDLRYGVLLDIAQKVLAEQPVEVETGYVNVIWQGDAVAQIIQCLSRAASPPTIVNVTGPETLSVRALAEGFGRRFEKAVTFAGRESEQCWLSNSRKARQWFGEPAVRVEQMMDWIADWLLRGGETLGKPTQFENRAGTYR
jgi:nucleoside-diphosphate-sugar epimerase